MKKQIIYLTILVFIPGFLVAQAAGNMYYNQKLSNKHKAETSYGGAMAGYGNQPGYQQQAANNTQYYDYGQGADSVMTIRSSVLTNVKPDAYKMVLGLTQVG